MKYVFLFCGTRDEQQMWEAMPEEERRAAYERVGRWFADNQAKIGAAQQLQPPTTATTVRFSATGEPLVHDGPFIEGNEVVGGYAEVEVADLDEALRLAKSWPGRGPVEVRPVVAR